ncbi:deazapurine DNA modification protein DpdA family protein [Pseudaminobacter sp. NGMCC 1.201702]|uniref:deazapurine DNA modification protein DpdA family protein n=1 Tax=Pseudaminobacter sp. NGMCC 1.201702 TaxID=3391825 RepID=UPI0039F12E1F
MNVRFFVGLHQPADAQHFDLACISINRLRGRKKPIDCGEVLLDSGAFTELNLYCGYRHGVEEYAAELHRLHTAGVVKIAAAVAQDYMCEPFMLAKTGLTIGDHQRLTVERYDALKAELDRLVCGECPFSIMPVLQGYAPSDYVRHIEMYGGRLKFGMWAGVGSVCKRNGDPEAIVEVLTAIHRARPDLLLHGFGVKRTSLMHPGVRELLYSADSMAWSFAARRQGRDGNSWQEAKTFADRVQAAASKAFDAWQLPLPLWRFVA